MISIKFLRWGLLSFIIVLVASISFLVGCGGDADDDASDFSNVKKSKTSGLSDWQMANGFGPVKKKLKLGEINPTLAKEGEGLFDTKCGTCHKLDERYTGPAQRDVLQRISPEFFLNMVLNPDENIEKHPRAKKMLAEYMNKMTNQNVNMKEARALLEFFRVLDEELKQNQQTTN
jgi:hypothetical protein